MLAVRRVAQSARMESTSKHGLRWRAILFLTSGGICEQGPRGHVERLIRCGGQADVSDADCNFKPRLERDWLTLNSLSQHKSLISTTSLMHWIKSKPRSESNGLGVLTRGLCQR